MDRSILYFSLAWGSALILGRASRIAVDMKDGDDNCYEIAAGGGCGDESQEYEPKKT